MKKSVKKVLSLMLVLAVLLTSIVVNSVSAAGASDPMQTALFKALHLSTEDKGKFNTILNSAESNIDSAASEMNGLFPEITVADAQRALEKYKSLTDPQKNRIQAAILVFNLNEISNASSLGFPTIVEIVNTELTGDPANNDGISLMIQVIKYLNMAGKNGAYVTDAGSDNTKMTFIYNSSDALVAYAKDSVNDLISSMGTIQTKIAGRTEATDFDKLLGYTADTINSAPDPEIAALKSYLNGINDSYYQPATSGGNGTGGNGTGGSGTSGGGTGGGGTGGGGTGVSGGSSAPVTATNNTGAVLVSAIITGTIAKVTADQVKIADVTAVADAILAKAAEAAKQGEKFEKKLVLEVDVKGAASLDLALPADLFSKIKEKGLDTVEVKAGEVLITLAPDFTAALKDAKVIKLIVDKLTVTDSFKAKLSDEQKKLLVGNDTVFDFKAVVITADGKEKKLTSFDKALTIKVKYALKAGESKDKLTVLYLAEDGTVENMAGRYDDTAKLAVFNTKHFSTYMIKNVTVTFHDINAGAWYKNQAESLAAKGIVGGKGDNNFAPGANVTRAEFMVMLVKAMGAYDKDATCSFTDVSKDSWYYTYVASAVKAGITNGVGNNKFGPNNNITRQEMAVMITNALSDKTIDNADKYLTASDANTISSYARNAMALCVKNEFMTGSNNKLTPKATATRAMAAAVIYKYFNFVY